MAAPGSIWIEITGTIEGHDGLHITFPSRIDIGTIRRIRIAGGFILAVASGKQAQCEGGQSGPRMDFKHLISDQVVGRAEQQSQMATPHTVSFAGT